LRKLTLNGVEDTPVAAGDTVYVGPGTYRELLTVDVSGTAGNPITYIGDYLGTNTDGIGGIVRITGSDNDQTGTRANVIVAGGARNYRTFTGFVLDIQAAGALMTANGNACTNWIVQQCIFASSGSQNCLTINSTSSSWTIQNCLFYGTNNSISFSHTSVVDNSGHLVSNCIFLSGNWGVQITRVGGITVKNCMFLSRSGLQVVTAITVGQTITVNNCLFLNENIALSGTVSGEIIENYNNFIGNGTDRTNTATGANSLAYAISLDTRWFFNAIYSSQAAKLIMPFDLASYSQLLDVAGTSPSTTDLRGTAVQGAQREWGALEYDSTLKAMGGFIKTASGLPLTNIKTINGLA
jgi:hypothetical protein